MLRRPRARRPSRPSPRRRVCSDQSQALATSGWWPLRVGSIAAFGISAAGSSTSAVAAWSRSPSPSSVPCRPWSSVRISSSSSASTCASIAACSFPPRPLGLRHAPRERVVVERLDCSSQEIRQHRRAQRGKGVDFRLLDAPGLAPSIRALLTGFERRGRQIHRTHLVDGQGYRNHFKIEMSKFQIAQGLQLTADGDGHLPAGWIANRRG